jgi:hypothetical protein
VANVLDFQIEALSGAKSLIPYIDGTPLIELVAVYEVDRGYEPAGGYGGLIPAHFNFGELTLYYEARAARQWPRPERAWLLGCDCGDVGCWPLTARVTVTAERVTWSNFEQEHRPSRDYTGFGPFVFDHAQYANAVTEAAEASRE